MPSMSKYCQVCMYLICWVLSCVLGHLFSVVFSLNIPNEESKCLLEQTKIFQCGQSQLSAKDLIWQRHQAIQGDVVGLSWVILILSKILQEQVALSHTQVLRIEDLWEDIRCSNDNSEY